MLEDFKNAFKNFKSNKTRTFLSLLGVIIGVASVIVITSLGSSTTKKIQDTFGSAGLDVVSVSAGFMSRRGSSSSVQFNEAQYFARQRKPRDNRINCRYIRLHAQKEYG